ncbi:14686_t:CDS:1 [Racocetra fulgida]|uniref:14686_t:CDS:1 n=1 Tax=Racocetra fulgida TaxID=60492 RepID=A0A9N9FTV6_9GLOM|nr:14686_t:CDS:1 [Racocetra fulgida]
MNRLLFIHLFLLVALFVTNAVNAAVPKKKLFDQRCRIDRTNVEKIFVSVNPDPVVAGKNVTFSVSGFLSQDIADNGEVRVSFFSVLETQIGGGSAPAPPTKAENTFSVDTTLEAPALLPDPYIMQVVVVNPNDPADPQKDIIGCIGAVVGTNVGPGGLESPPNGSANKIAVGDSFLVL